MLSFEGAPRVSEARLDVRLGTADVYFLVDTTQSMGEEISVLSDALTRGNFLTDPVRCGLPADAGAGTGALAPEGYEGLIGAIRCQIPNVAFGIGTFDDFPFSGYGDASCPVDGQDDSPFSHLLNMTLPDDNGLAALTSAVTSLRARCGGDLPESHVAALYALATGEALPRTDSSVHFQVPPHETLSTLGMGGVGDTFETPYHLGDVTDTLQYFRFDFDQLNNLYRSSCRHGGGSEQGEGRDAVFSFTLTKTQEIVLTTHNHVNVDTMLRLYAPNDDYLYCHNGFGNSSSIFQVLTPGTYKVMLETRSTEDGRFADLLIGTWQTTSPPLTPAKSDCAPGHTGYPCFREGSKPIVVLFSDAPMHNASAQAYTMPSPALHNATYALNQQNIKVIGINSGSDSSLRSCFTPCMHEITTDCSQEEYAYPTNCYQCNPYACSVSTQTGTVTTTCYQWCCDDSETRFRERCGGTCAGFGDQVCEFSSSTAGGTLKQVAHDTGTVDDAGFPLVLNVGADGSGLSEAVVQAISELAGSTVMDVSLRAVDNPATSGINEGDFVDSVNALPTAAASARCDATLPTYFRRCMPDTEVAFGVTFHNVHVVPTAEDQLFTFNLEVVGDGTFVLQTIPVTILVPGTGSSFALEGRYSHDYDVSAECGGSGDSTHFPVFTETSWNVDLSEAGTETRFELRLASSAAGLDSATPMTRLASTVASPVAIGPLVESAGLSLNAAHARLTAVLLASPDGQRAPTLHDMALRFRCQAAD